MATWLFAGCQIAGVKGRNYKFFWHKCCSLYTWIFLKEVFLNEGGVMKRLFPIFPVFLIIFILVSCNNKETNQSLGSENINIDPDPNEDPNKLNYLDSKFSFELDKAELVKKSIVSGFCANDSSEIKSVNTIILGNSFELGAAFSSKLLIDMNFNEGLYKCNLSVTGLDGNGDKVLIAEDVKINLNQNDSHGIFFPLDNPVFHRDLFEIKKINFNTEEELILICEGGYSVAINGDYTPLSQHFENTPENFNTVPKCVISNSKYGTPDYKWSKQFRVINFRKLSITEMDLNLENSKLENCYPETSDVCLMFEFWVDENQISLRGKNIMEKGGLFLVKDYEINNILHFNIFSYFGENIFKNNEVLDIKELDKEWVQNYVEQNEFFHIPAGSDFGLTFSRKK